MARRIFVRLAGEPPPDWLMAITDGGATTLLPLSQYRQRSGDELTVLVPGTEIVELEVTLPARTEREARRAAPFTIEEDVGTPVEDLHIAIGPRSAEGRRRVLACSKSVMAEWMATISAAGLEADSVVPDFAMMPSSPSIVDLGDSILVSNGEKRFALDAGLGDEILQAVAGSLPASADVYGARLASRLGRPAMSDVLDPPVLQLGALAASAPGLVDLRQGEFGGRRSSSLPGFSNWRRPALLAAAAALAWGAVILAETRALQNEGEYLRERAQDIYAARFPAEGRVSDPATRIRSRLDQGGGGELDFRNTLAALYDSLSGIEGASLSGLRFDAARRELRASVDYASYGDDSRLARALEERGLTAELGDARSSGRGVSGEIRIGANR